MSPRLPVAATAALISLAAFAAPTRAADQVVLGKSFVVSDPAPGGDPALRKVTATGKESTTAATIVGDPLAHGASVEIIANGASPSAQLFTLPAGAPVNGFAGWKAIGSPVIGYSYRDPQAANGPLRQVIIKKTKAGGFLLKVAAKGSLGAAPQPHITVVPPAPGSDGGIRLAIGGGDTYCVRFGGAAGGLVTNALDRVFKVASAAGYPTTAAGCPVSALTTTTSIATTSTSSSSSTTTSTSTSTSSTESTSTSTSTSTIETTSSSTSSSETTSTSSSTSTSDSTSTSETTSTVETSSSSTSTSSSSSTTSTSTSTSSTTSLAGANFDVDPHVRACYDFEVGAVTADAASGGSTACGSTADTLTNDGGVLANGATFQEGSASADYSATAPGVGLRCNAGCPEWDVSSVNRFTFAVWIRPSHIADVESPIIGRIGDTVFQYYATIMNADSRVHLKVTDAGCVPFTGVDIAATEPVSLTDWTHVAGTYDIDTGQARLYVNGKLDGSSTAVSGPLCSGAAITWNGIGENGGGFFAFAYAGGLDEARIFDRALTDAEICSLCRFGANGSASHTCACP